MSIEIVQSILAFCGGLGLFIYGMEVMGDGLSQAAGTKTKKLLSLLTQNQFMAVLAGALVTAIIQSSSAVTVLVVGFVNASLMSLMQATGVIMGANIGTTMTAWIVSMGEWAAFLKPEMIAPALLFIGVGIHLFSQSSRIKDFAHILIGFGLLFIGLASMSSSIRPYTDLPIFSEAFRILGTNPLLGILTGAIITAIIQSSSASMGILQTLALTGAVNWGSAVYIALGQNIGTCVTALLSSISGDTNAKRAAMIHLEFNTIGAILVACVAGIYFMFMPSMRSAPVGSTSLALFHTGFNVAVTIVLYPFAKQLVNLSKILVPSTKESLSKELDTLLDPRFLPIPEAALSAVNMEMERIGRLCLTMLEQSRAVLIDHEETDKLFENSQHVLKACRHVRDYLEKLDPSLLTMPLQQQILKNLLKARDFLQISVSCQRLAKLLPTEEAFPLQESSIEEINTLSSLCISALQKVLALYEGTQESSQDQIYEKEVLHLANQVYAKEQALSNQNILFNSKQEHSLQESWFLMEVSDLYLQIVRRIVRLEDETSWKNPGLISFQAH